MRPKLPVIEQIAPSVPLELTLTGGRVLSFRLSFDYNALALVEEKTGYNLHRGAIFNNVTASNLSVLLWASLQNANPEYEGDLGLKAVRSYLTLSNRNAVENAIQEAYMASLPDDERERIKEVAKKAAEALLRGIKENQPDSGEVPLEQAPANS